LSTSFVQSLTFFPNPPSFEAHQFLFSGTSAPTASNDATLCYDSSVGRSYPCYQWFAAELQNDQGVFGCPGTADNIVEVSPAGPSNEFLGIYNGGYPCYNHDTLADLLDNAKLTWKYYPQGPNPGTSLWTAPNAIRKICMPLISSGLECNGSEWNSNVAPQIPPTPPVAGKMAPILSDIQNCNLANVSWVIPDGKWSDHPGEGPLSYLGPSWVADIVNAVGNNGTCKTNEVYWDDTVILITWDDWGGWYDHINPLSTAGGPGIGYPNLTGQQYVYGFRVPLLVVSAYNYRPQGSTGYISGTCVGEIAQTKSHLTSTISAAFSASSSMRSDWARSTRMATTMLTTGPRTALTPGAREAYVLSPSRISSSTSRRTRSRARLRRLNSPARITTRPTSRTSGFIREIPRRRTRMTMTVGRNMAPIQPCLSGC
jgi:hypothetical protein